MPSSTAQVKIQRERGALANFQHIRPLRADPRGSKGRHARGQGGMSAAKAASNTRFSGQRHVVSGARMWQTSP